MYNRLESSLGLVTGRMLRHGMCSDGSIHDRDAYGFSGVRGCEGWFVRVDNTLGTGLGGRVSLWAYVGTLMLALALSSTDPYSLALGTSVHEAIAALVRAKVS